MKFLSSLVFSFFASWAYTVGAVVVPGADTPLFYFVSTSGTRSANLLPLRISGGTDDFATFTGIGPIGQLYFDQGKLVAQDPNGSTNIYKPFISAIPSSSGCTAYGPLGFIQGSTTNKCASFDNFQIQSDTENSQLGAALVFNYQGGFYACGPSQDIWYKTSGDQGPADCSAVALYTVPVVG